MHAKRYGPWAIVAGGSEGIGEHFARLLAKDGINILLAARNEQRLQTCAARIRESFGVEVRTLPVDLATHEGVEELMSAASDLEVGLLVCNAGADYGNCDFLDATSSRSEQLINLNVLGPTLLCHHFGRAMRERGRGGLILVGSLSGNAAHAGATTYSGAKAYLQRFAEGLWHELSAHGVHVLSFVVSLTKTPAMIRHGLSADHPDFPAAEAADVAQDGLDHLPFGPVHYANNRAAFAATLNALPRGEAVIMMSRAVKGMFRHSAVSSHSNL
jgi:short-subunit dehydrogenase